ncbi:MAG TPA: hypothetical protein VHT53_01085 [Candidatus Elarobacter sp.]|jgi:hypothetical protein|nr:hypothetical protein [Candidatus Elarobacter sp.]
MEAAPIKPQPPAPRPTGRGAPAGAAKKPAHAAAAPPATPNDFATLAQQSAFDAIASARAEAQREMNVLRDLAMQQVKRDDTNVNAWIKLV